jgi:L-ascorbate metabolism protein UlaG (beta-lactamase superfamily)
MSSPAVLRYYGWSGLSIDTDDGSIFFDPFFRPYCGAAWFKLEDFTRATYICVTHGHEEHFLDVPVVAHHSSSTIIGSPSVCRFLNRRNKVAPSRLLSIDPLKFQSIDIPGFHITAFPWQHRDINLYKALSKAVFHGNATQLSWAWSSAINAPFYSPYTGYHIQLADGSTILNYNEGFNSKMTDAEIKALGTRFRTDVLLAGMQLDFVDDVVRGVAALQPKVVVLYPPHEHFHAMMGVVSTPWSAFAEAIKTRFCEIDVHIASPGFELTLDGHAKPQHFSAAA